MHDVQSLDEQDKLFARKLEQRDTSVIAEIDKAYAPAISNLLATRLQPADIDAVVQEAIFDLWNAFRPDCGSSVRAMLFQIAHNKARDTLRRKYRQQNLLARKIEQATTQDLVDHREAHTTLVEKEEPEIRAASFDRMISLGIDMINATHAHLDP